MEPTNETPWDVLREANEGDTTALATLRNELSGPNRGVLIFCSGNLPRQVERAALNVLGPQQSGAKIIIQENLIVLRKELAATNTIENLIVERITLTYLQLHLAEMKLLQSNSESRALQHRVESLSRSYLKAVRSQPITECLGGWD